MKYLSVKEVAKLWNISERSVRNYCASGRLPGAFLTGKTWNIPENAEKPDRINKSKPSPRRLLDVLKEEKRSQIHGGIYHKIQIDLTYNSNHIEGSRLTHDQTRYIFETNTIGITEVGIRVDDIIETTNHFRCIDEIIENANSKLSEKFIKHLHFILKSGTTDSKKDWFAVGDYKRLPNEVGGIETTLPEDVSNEMKQLLEGSPLWATLLSVSVFAPLFEEWLCRGIVLRGLLRKMSPAAAISISAAFFAILHMNPWQAIPAFCLGLLFGYVYYRTGSLKLTMLMHCVTNTFAALISQVPVFKDAETFMGIMNPWAYAGAYTACILILASALVIFRAIPFKGGNLGGCDKVESL